MGGSYTCSKHSAQQYWSPAPCDEHNGDVAYLARTHLFDSRSPTTREGTQNGRTRMIDPLAVSTIYRPSCQESMRARKVSVAIYFMG